MVLRNQTWKSGDTTGSVKMCIDAFDNIIVGGYFQTWSNNGEDLSMVKYDSSGILLWFKTYNNQSYTSNDEAYDITIDNEGNSFITGVSGQVGQMGWDYVTIKYEPNGELAWVRRYNPLTASDDWAYSVAIDKFGNAYVTGKSNHYNLGYGYTTIKYTPTGIQERIERYDGGAIYNGISEAKKILLDSNLKIYISGNSNITGINEIATIKPSQSTGIRNISGQVPDKYSLEQNYPNPFNPETKIKFEVPLSKGGLKGVVTLKIYDITGREIQTLNNQISRGVMKLRSTVLNYRVEYIFIN